MTLRWWLRFSANQVGRSRTNITMRSAWMTVELCQPLVSCDWDVYISDLKGRRGNAEGRSERDGEARGERHTDPSKSIKLVVVVVVGAVGIPSTISQPENATRDNRENVGSSAWLVSRGCRRPIVRHEYFSVFPTFSFSLFLYIYLLVLVFSLSPSLTLTSHPVRAE